MAEIGLIASITGCIGFGTKLAMTLYTFGDNIKSTGREVCLVHHEISLFCAVLRHIKAALDDSRDARFSTAGLLTIHEIIERCTETFKELESILLKLQSESKVDGGKPEVTFVAKVKWTFQRTRVQLLQRNIESFKNTLQLMLSTLDLSRIIHRQP
jgi:hypothetical protein